MERSMRRREPSARMHGEVTMQLREPMQPVKVEKRQKRRATKETAGEDERERDRERKIEKEKREGEERAVRRESEKEEVVVQACSLEVARTSV